MKTFLYALLFSLIIAPASAIAQSGSFADDYVWQDRFKKAMSKAEEGIAKAQYKVGEMYEKGRGTPKDPAQAFSWYERASKQNYMKAQYKLGYMYFKGMGVSKNRTKAYALFQKPAEKGNVRAQYYLGRLYAAGQGVEKDSEMAMLWYSRSSLGGYTPAEEALAEVKQHLASLTTEAAKPAIKKSVSKAKKKSANTTKSEKNNPVKVAKKSTLSDKILKGGWMKRKRPAEFLPSKITKCENQSASVVECISSELKRDIGPAKITYITKAIIYEMKKSGEFKVAYRNKILKINKKQLDLEDGEEAPKVTVKKGWQETEHQLECKVSDKASINCVKNKIKKMKFNRNLKT